MSEGLSQRDRLAALLHLNKPLARAIHEDFYAMQDPSFGWQDCRACKWHAEVLTGEGVTVGLDVGRLWRAIDDHAPNVNAKHGYLDHCGAVCVEPIVAEYDRLGAER